MITEILYGEVTRVENKTEYLNGYDKPPVKYTAINISSIKQDNQSGIRAASITIPGNLPCGVQFKITVEQIDEVTPATINRGALPIIKDSKLIEGTK